MSSSASYTTPTTWRKSSRCNSTGADCVEVANLPDGRWGVRDSTTPDDAVLTVPAARFAAFVAAINSGQFDQSAC